MRNDMKFDLIKGGILLDHETGKAAIILELIGKLEKVPAELEQQKMLNAVRVFEMELERQGFVFASEENETQEEHNRTCETCSQANATSTTDSQIQPKDEFPDFVFAKIFGANNPREH